MMEIDDKISGFRNKLRKYSLMSIVNQALRVLHNEYSSPLDKLKAMPGLTLLIVKWAVQDIFVYQSIGRVIAPQEFDELRQLLWDIQGRMSSGQNTPNVYAMLRATLHSQVQFQRKETWGFLRWPALIAQLDLSHPNRIQFETTFSMSPKTYMDLSFALYAPALKGEMRLSPDYFKSLRGYYGDSMTAFLEIFSRDLPSLRKELRKELQTKEGRPLRGKIEIFEFPFLQRFPILEAPNKDMIFWHPLVFARGMEDAVHLRLSKFRADYTEPFSKVFEGYVLGLLQEARISFFGDEEVRKTFSRRASTVDAIIDCDDCNIFIEAKMSLFWDDVLLDDDPQQVFNKTERVRTAIRQGWQASDLLRTGRRPLGMTANKERDFLLVVTSRQLNISGGIMLNDIYPEGSFEKVLPLDKRKYLPPENIFVLSIEDFERLIGCQQAGDAGKVELASVLKEAATANSNPQTSRMFFSDFLRGQTHGVEAPRLIQLAIENSTARLKIALEGNDR